MRGEDFDAYLTNTQSFYDAVFHDPSIIAGRTIMEKNMSLSDAEKSGYRDIYRKLHDAIEAYSGDGEFIWHIGDDDPLGFTTLL